MKEERERPVALGSAVAKPDILAEVERGAAAAGLCGGHRGPPPRTAPAGPSQGDWPGQEVKSEEGVSPPPASPPTHRAGPSDGPVLLRERGCSCCGALEPELDPGTGTGGFVSPPPGREPPPECGECGRGSGQRPDLGRHRRARGEERAPGCGRCGGGTAEAVGLGGTGSSCRPPGAAEGPGPLRKERKELSLTEKVRVLEMLEGPKVSQSELAKRFGVSQPQICRIIKNKERILSEWQRSGDPERKRKREGKDAGLEAALLRWVRGARASRLPDGSSLLPPAARPDPRARTGCPARHGARHSLPSERPLWEEGDAEQPTAERWAGAVLPALLRSFAPAEIYACGESAVLVPAGSPGERLSLLLCANADGSEKVPLQAVGQNARPRCLRGINLEQMPWSYRAGGGAGLTAPLFTEWLRELNEGMRRRGKSVLLLLAEHEAHPYLQLSNVRMVFTPAAASSAQPLHHGIASDLKGHYRCRLLRWLAAERGAGQPTLLDVLHMLAQAWGDVSPGLISGCFRAAGVSPDVSPDAPVLGPEQPMDGELQHNGGPVDGDGGTAEGEDGAEPPAAPPCPSEREVWGSLATLRRYLECRATSPDLFQAFYELEDVVHMVTASAGRALLGDTPAKQ